MAFDVSGLSAYVKQEFDKLIVQTIFAPRTAEIIQQGGTVMSDVKSSAAIPYMETDAVFQAGGSCGFNASGTTTFSQRSITVGKIKVEEALCLADLEASFMQMALTPGANYDSPSDFKFAKDWVDRKIAKIAAQLETAIWQGDTGSGTANLNKFDGLQKIIAAASNEIDANATAYGLSAAITTAGGGITVANAASVLDAIYRALPATVLNADDLAIFAGWDIVRLIQIAVRNSNYFHYTADAPGEITIPGTNVKVIAVNGLTGTSDLYAMRKSNLVLATDLLSDTNTFKLWYSDDDDLVKVSIKFKMGVNVVFPDEVVKFVVS